MIEGNFTRIPNSIMDNMLEFSDSEFRVLISICRQTFGWNRTEALMSISFISKATGMSRQGVIQGTKSLFDRGFIDKEQSGLSFRYAVNMDRFEVVNGVDQSTALTSTSQRRRPEVVNGVGTKKEKKEMKDITLPRPELRDIIVFCLANDLPESDAEFLDLKWKANGFTNNKIAIANWKDTILFWKRKGGVLESQKAKPKKPSKSSDDRQGRNEIIKPKMLK